MLFHRLLNDYSVTDVELLLTSCQKVPTVFEHRRIHKATKVNSAIHVLDWHYFLDREIRERDLTLQESHSKV